MGKLYWLLIAVLLLHAAPAGALSTAQVLELKKAGVSEAIIQKLIDNEMRAARQGSQGRYTVRQAGGGEVIVYQAGGSSGSQEEYPLEMDPAWRDSRGMRAILGKTPRSDVLTGRDQEAEPASQAPQASQASQGQTKAGGRYTLLLESHRELASATKRAKDLSAEGVESRVESVDLGAQGRWYRVLHGHFSEREQAEGQGEKLREVGGIGSYTVLAR
jgi:cell division septation protein DedD